MHRLMGLMGHGMPASRLIDRESTITPTGPFTDAV